jgi:hypothetical protein
MTRTTTSTATRMLLGAVALAFGVAACTGGDSDDEKGDNGGTPTPTPVVNPYEVCVAHFEVDAGDAPEVANLLLVVLLNEYWVGVEQDVDVDGTNGALYADYHYNFDGPALPEYVGAISTSATVVITSSNNELGTTATLAIDDEPFWYLTTGTSSTLSGGLGTVTGELQPLSDCASGCEYGTGDADILVNGSALTLGSTSPDGVALLYCRDLPASFAGWRPGKPLPPGFREVFR